MLRHNQFSEERWRSEGVQVGGVGSARGVLGNWFDKHVSLRPIIAICFVLTKNTTEISTFMVPQVQLHFGNRVIGLLQIVKTIRTLTTRMFYLSCSCPLGSALTLDLVH